MAKTRITLSDRAEEMLSMIPKEYLPVIVNSIIAKSALNGTLLEEAVLFLDNSSYDELDEYIAGMREATGTTVKPKMPKTSRTLEPRKTKKEIKDEDDEADFTF